MPSAQRIEELHRWFETHAGHVCCFLRARLGPTVRGRLEVEDLLQEVWVRATQVCTDEPVPSPRGWLLSIARFVVMEALRTVRRRPVGVQAGESSQFELADAITTLTRRVARDELRQRFFAALDGLDEEERQMVVMHGFEERPLSAVAERLGIGVEAAHKRWQRLRDRLREMGSPADLF